LLPSVGVGYLCGYIRSHDHVLLTRACVVVIVVGRAQVSWVGGVVLSGYPVVIKRAQGLEVVKMGKTKENIRKIQNFSILELLRTTLLIICLP